jgi:putative membrane protein
MNLAWKLSAGLASLLHVLFFLLESVLFTRPNVFTAFKLDATQAETVRLWAFNQGFYNLFLAVGCVAGIALVSKCRTSGRTLVAFSCACMLGAGIVLVASDPTLAGAALVQGVPPLVAIVFLFRTRAQSSRGSEGDSDSGSGQ